MLRIMIYCLVCMLLMVSCSTRETYVVEELIPIDSLAYHIRSQGNIGMATTMLIHEGKLFIADITDSVYVFDLQSKEFLYAFGGTGTAPGKFSGISSMSITPVGHILFAETYNSRIQTTTAQGEWIADFPARMPVFVHQENSNIYYAETLMISNGGLHLHSGEGIDEEIFNLYGWLESMELKGEDVCRIGYINGQFIVSAKTNERDVLAVINKDKSVEELEYRDIIPEYNGKFSGKALSYHDGFIIPVTYLLGDYDDESMPTAVYLFAYDNGGKLSGVFSLSSQVDNLTDISTIDGNTLYAYNLLTGAIYIYELP